jgi:uncharacterized protein (TIGR04222 family)
MFMEINPNTLELAFLGTCGAHLAVTAAMSAVARGPHEVGPVDGGDRDVYELAALHGGAPCVATAALARLHASGCLALSGGSITTSWRLEGEVPPIERELYETIDLAPGTTADSIPGVLRRGPAYARIVTSLREAGLLPAASIAASLRCLKSLAWCYAPLLALALVAGQASTEGSAPWELVGVVLLMPILVISLVRRAEPATRCGLAVLERHRDRVRHLDHGRVADRDLGLAVALFGSEPLLRTHPALARAWGILSPEEVQLQAAMIG